MERTGEGREEVDLGNQVIHRDGGVGNSRLRTAEPRENVKVKEKDLEKVQRGTTQ